MHSTTGQHTHPDSVIYHIFAPRCLEQKMLKQVKAIKTLAEKSQIFDFSPGGQKGDKGAETWRINIKYHAK